MSSYLYLLYIFILLSASSYPLHKSKIIKHRRGNFWKLEGKPGQVGDYNINIEVDTYLTTMPKKIRLLKF